MQRTPPHFDDLLRGKLAEAPPATPSAAGWERLERQLDAPLPGETEIAEVLKQHEPTTVSGWAVLADKLELIGRRRELIAALKITEVALLTSVLLLLFQHQSIFTGTELSQHGFPAPVPATASLPSPADASRPLPLPEATVSSATELKSAVKLRTPLSTPPPAVVAPLSRPDIPVVTSGAGSEFPLPSSAPIRTPSAPEALPQPAIQPLTSAASTQPAPPLQLQPLQKHPRSEYYLNVFYSPLDLTEVSTRTTYFQASNDRTYEIAGERRLTYGSSMGLSLDIEKGNLGLQVGLIYGTRSYTPTPLLYLIEEVGLGTTVEDPEAAYSKIVFNSISVPVNAVQTVYRHPDWRVSLRFGGALNTIVESRFDAENGDRVQISELRRFSSLLPPNNSNGRAVSRQRPLVDVTDVERGWLEGGSFLANSRLEVGGGLLVERLLFDGGLSLYVQPTMNRTLYINAESGVGPYTDRLHAYQIRVGSRISLGKH